MPLNYEVITNIFLILFGCFVFIGGVAIARYGSYSIKNNGYGAKHFFINGILLALTGIAIATISIAQVFLP